MRGRSWPLKTLSSIRFCHLISLNGTLFLLKKGSLTPTNPKIMQCEWTGVYPWVMLLLLKICWRIYKNSQPLNELLRGEDDGDELECQDRSVKPRRLEETPAEMGWEEHKAHLQPVAYVIRALLLLIDILHAQARVPYLKVGSSRQVEVLPLWNGLQSQDK